MMLSKFTTAYSHQLRSFSTLIIGEQKGGKLNPATLSALTAGIQLNKPIDILLTGPLSTSLKDSVSTSLASPLTNSIVFSDQEFQTGKLQPYQIFSLQNSF
jgi:hypothetical protein